MDGDLFECADFYFHLSQVEDEFRLYWCIFLKFALLLLCGVYVPDGMNDRCTPNFFVCCSFNVAFRNDFNSFTFLLSVLM